MRSASRLLIGGTAATLLLSSLSVFAGTAAPDISGVWSGSAADAAQAANDPPLKPRYLKKYIAARNTEAKAQAARAETPERCRVEGVPTMMAARGALEIVQTPGQVTVLAEYMNQTRRIFMDEALPALADVNPGYTGYSVGKWNGDTLEVQTVGVREDVRYLGIPHSAKMKILEKIRLTGPGQLQDEVTIVDRDTLTQPYHLTFNYQKLPQHRVLEYACSHAGAEAAPPDGKRR
jgi:hypothetical protein